MTNSSDPSLDGQEPSFLGKTSYARDPAGDGVRVDLEVVGRSCDEAIMERPRDGSVPRVTISADALGEIVFFATTLVDEVRRALAEDRRVSGHLSRLVAQGPVVGGSGAADVWGEVVHPFYGYPSNVFRLKAPCPTHGGTACGWADGECSTQEAPASILDAAGRVDPSLVDSEAEVLIGDASALSSRTDRQARIFAWAKAAFSVEQATSLPQRGVRLLEEALEAFQAAGGGVAVAHDLVDFVFARPVGTLSQELGGVGVCALALAAAAGLSADEEERREMERVLSKPLEHFRQRNEAKNAAGFLMTPCRSAVAAPVSFGAPDCRAIFEAAGIKWVALSSGAQTAAVDALDRQLRWSRGDRRLEGEA